MQLTFIRHGQGEHTLNMPDSLQTRDPGLTDLGRRQAIRLGELFPLSSEDVMIISPTRRTLETALFWRGELACRQIIHPYAGPRVFPLIAGKFGLPCDQLLPKHQILKDFPGFEFAQNIPDTYWQKGINILPEDNFIKLAREFIDWCKQLNLKKLYIVSHDGTITSYRPLIEGTPLSRDDFPLETGAFQVTI
ncbi:histidine phosphatase family protein [Bacillus sp. M6-12]|uniref:histidine phosphatase family protein n=1 Tax=Bacillus sp. M6-12 TaxID=2054166 RepID=UPI000C77425E|nr:histidine phosphatase family protein [Bacillus sp. M6-12]PLS18311.1 histidine phosphatase family protein [Bacillus sp. M6-12]